MLGSYSPDKKDKQGTPVFIPEWKWRATTKAGHVYLIIFEWPKDGTFTVPTVAQEIVGASAWKQIGRLPSPFSAP